MGEAGIENYYDKEMEGCLLPIINTPELKSTTPWYVYMLRMTPDGKYSRGHLEAYIDNLSQRRYVCAMENSKKSKIHFHITIVSHLEEEEIRDAIREFLKVAFPDPPKRGDANKQYNLTLARDVNKAFRYTIKEKDITYGDGIKKSYMDKCLKTAYLKFDKHTYKTKYEAIRDNYLEYDLTDSDLFIKIVQLKADYRQPINMAQIHQQVISCICHKYPHRTEQFVNDYIAKISRW